MREQPLVARGVRAATREDGNTGQTRHSLPGNDPKSGAPMAGKGARHAGTVRFPEGLALSRRYGVPRSTEVQLVVRAVRCKGVAVICRGVAMGLLFPFASAVAGVGGFVAPPPAVPVATSPPAVAANANRFQASVATFGGKRQVMTSDGRRASAGQGNAELQFQVGQLYFRGNGVDKDEQEALRWYRRAAEQGHAEAQFMLGAALLLGWDAPLEGVKWLRRAASQGNEAAIEVLAYTHFTAAPVMTHTAPALRPDRQRAGHGDAVAQFNLAESFRTGNGVAANADEALQWYIRAAENNHVEAQLYLATVYGEGRIVPVDDEAVERWLRRAAGQGSAEGQYRLGTHLIDSSAAKVRAEGMRWLRQAADAGHEQARWELGRQESVAGQLTRAENWP